MKQDWTLTCSYTSAGRIISRLGRNDRVFCEEPSLWKMTYAADKYAYSTSSSTDFKEYTRVYFQKIELYRTMQSYLEEFRKTIHCVFVECFARH